MDKRYQVFVSSTYADLQKERRNVIQTLMEMDCIPAGMELFPAVDAEQFEFIKRVIDDCDYYLVIIGGRYGSVDGEGLSYTEKEYDYAVQKGLKVVAFLHDDPTTIALGKSEKDPELRERLQAFRGRVGTGRLVKFWKTAEDLPGLVALSMTKTIKTYPAVGWVRANTVASVDLLNEVNTLRRENKELRLKAARSPTSPLVENLAGLDENFKVTGQRRGKGGASWSTTRTWRELFAIVGPHLLETPNDTRVWGRLSKALGGPLGVVDDEPYQTIKIQLSALGLVQIHQRQTTVGGMALFWSLTPSGKQVLYETLAIRTKPKAKNKDE